MTLESVSSSFQPLKLFPVPFTGTPLGVLEDRAAEKTHKYISVKEKSIAALGLRFPGELQKHTHLLAQLHSFLLRRSVKGPRFAASLPLPHL